MTKIIILAAGKGTRMKSSLPKVLVSLNNKAMIKYLLDAVFATGIKTKPILVVSPDNIEIMKESLKEYDLEYVIQDKQLGTGHAVSCALPKIGPEIKNIVVLYGDHPFIKSNSIKKLITTNPGSVAITPALLPDYSSYRHNFYHWGRIIRNDKNEVLKIVEFKDASDAEKLILEVNPGFMCFNCNWLKNNIIKLKDNNNQKEYYLTDMVKLAFESGHFVETIAINSDEIMGINSQEELNLATSLFI